MYSFRVGDLVEIRQPYGKEECSYGLGLILKESMPLINVHKYNILWLTKHGKCVINWYEGGNLMLISAKEGNEKRYARYRVTKGKL